jgi:hypothetical protein
MRGNWAGGFGKRTERRIAPDSTADRHGRGLDRDSALTAFERVAQNLYAVASSSHHHHNSELP